MPGYDRSGPMGNGSMSGGGRGLCGSAAHPQRFAVSERGNWGGLGCRRGFGNPRGRGLRRGFGPLAEPTDGERQVNEKELLETQASELRQSLTRIQQRLDEL